MKVNAINFVLNLFARKRNKKDVAVVDEPVIEDRPKSKKRRQK